MGLIIGQGTKSVGGGGDVRLETNHSATISENGTHVVTPQEGYDGMRKATIKVDVEAADPTDKALVANATQYGLSHNLYKVMEEVKADPRTQGYAAIMLCQYYKGYNSLSLEGGADAFLTSDGDFYQGNAVHYWHDSNDTMFDRWVAMLFGSESGSYTCSNALLCPRAALIDGTMGDINVTANNMRFAWIDVTDGSSFGQYYQLGNNYVCQWNRAAVIRGMRSVTRGTRTTINLNGVSSAIVKIKNINATCFQDTGNALTSISFDDLESITGSVTGMFYSGATALLKIVANDLVSATKLFYLGSLTAAVATNVRYIVTPKLKYLGYLCGNDNTPTNPNLGWASLIHFEIGQGFFSDLNLRMCTFADCIKTDANDLVEDVVVHPSWSNLDQWLYNFDNLIVDKLADLSGQTAKTITLTAAPYAAITSEIRSKMSAKNWNLASA